MATITNQATLSYSGGTVVSNVATGEIIEVLTASKTALPETYSVGDNVAYIVSIINSGDSAVTGITLTDDLGAYAFGEETLYPLTYIEGSVKMFEAGEAVAEPTGGSSAPLTLTGITVPAGGSVSIAYAAKVNQYAPLGDAGSIENTATVDGAGITPITASATVTADADPVLAVTKSIDPATVKASGALNYTFVISNYGARDTRPSDSVKITDVFSPVLTSLAASLDGAPLAVNTDYTYDETDGVFETVEGVITVPAATYAQNEDGTWTVSPGETTLTVTGNII